MYQHIKKGKITITIGPASQSPERVDELIHRGVNVFRLNFSHGTHAEHGKRIKTIREVSKKIGVPVGILLDTKGPEIRIGRFKNGKATLQKDSSVTIVTDRDIEGNEKTFSVSHRKLAEDVMIGTRLLIDDGQVELKVLSKSKGKIVAKVLNTYEVLGNKGMNCPGTPTTLKFISDRDKEDIKFGCKNNINYIAPSFVRNKEDLAELKKLIAEYGGSEDIQIFPKIESQEGVDHFDEILENSDGIMIARGDLGVELPYESVPRYQRIFIQKCNEAGKPVIVATQMLQTMVHNPYPTRAEVSDIYWAMELGADSTMLSAESAIGTWPLESVRVMYNVSRRAENDIDYEVVNKAQLQVLLDQDNKYTSIANRIATKMRHDRYHSVMIVLNTVPRDLVKALSVIRTRFGIIPLLTDWREAENYSINWGVQSYVVGNISHYYDRDRLEEIARKRNARGGDKVLYIIQGPEDLVVLTITI